MATTKNFLILACCIFTLNASEHSHSHTIPVEGYETELENLGEHIEIPETPVKVIKITKTIAVKVPVPYPVKVIEKVPYPVHINKPYPVPVPQIIHAPQPAPQKPHHEALQEDHYSGRGDHSYQVQESPSYESHNGNSGLSYGADGDENSYEAFPNNYNGYSSSSDGHGSLESKSYDEAINDYLQKHQSGNTNGGGSGGYHFH